MENTGKFQLNSDEAVWFLSQGEHAIGPMTAAEIQSKVESGEITMAHYAWKNGQSDWKRICDIRTFKVLTPEAPKKKLIQDLKKQPKVIQSKRKKAPPPPPSEAYSQEKAEEPVWFVFQDAQYGPFTTEEVIRSIKIQKFSSQTHIWKDGMADWVQIGQQEDFQNELPKKTSKPSKQLSPAKTDERRGAPRRPLVARILMTDEDRVIVGICRDISVGGMQVLTDILPGQAGDLIKLNVSPAAPDLIGPFVAEGEIVRVLEDGRGFSFRFKELSPESRKTIEKYVSH